MRRLLLAAVAALPLLAAGAARAAEPQPLDRAGVERIVRDYLLKNPEVIYQALQELQRRHEAEEAQRQQVAIKEHKSQIFGSADDPVAGNPEGKATLVEFFDYRCGYCRSMVPGIRALLAKDPDLRLVLKDIPILSPESTVAAKAALASARQGRYADMHFALMASKDLSRDAILATAESLGLDAGRLARDMDEPEIAAKIDANLKLAEALGINGTPAFVVGDKLVPGAVEVSQLAAMLSQERTTKTD